jgi:hypothetical protein
VISGECRVEGMPSPDPSSPSGRKLALDGLRLQLDLRIVPSASGGDASAAAIWRIDSESVATLALGTCASYRRVAMAAGVAVLALAVGVWFLGGPAAPTDARWSSEPIEQATPPAPPSALVQEARARATASAASPQAPATDAAAAPPVSEASTALIGAPATVAPGIAVVRADSSGPPAPAPGSGPLAPAPGSGSASPLPAPRVPPRPDGVARPRRGKAASPGSAVASAGASPAVNAGTSSPERAASTPGRTASRSPDALLDLFGDTK